MLTIIPDPDRYDQYTLEGPALLGCDRSRAGRRGLLVVPGRCDLATSRVELAVYLVTESAAKLEVDEGGVAAVGRDGAVERLEPVFGAVVDLREATLRADPDADPEQVFWVDEALDGELMDVMYAELDRALRAEGLVRRSPATAPPRVGRNAPCPCGSGKKFKKCCEGGTGR